METELTIENQFLIEWNIECVRFRQIHFYLNFSNLTIQIIYYAYFRYTRFSVAIRRYNVLMKSFVNWKDMWKKSLTYREFIWEIIFSVPRPLRIFVPIDTATMATEKFDFNSESEGKLKIIL